MSNTNPVTFESINPQDAKLEALRSLFPEAFCEWKLDTNLLSATLGESISNERESYGMSWAGKSDARKQIVTPTTKSLSPDEASSVDFTNTDNILIEWDNLEVLKLLQKSYTKQVKMIYIDPPYNTGKDFVYHDNFHASTAEYEEASGQRDSEWAKLVQNTETNWRYHSDWLSMMYPRLHLARNLLKDEGAIFVSIDDHEAHNLRKIMDEVFWEENFIVQFVWEKHKAPKNDNKYVSENHEYILMYAKNKNNFIINKMPRTEENLSSFSNADNDPRWLWISWPLLAPTYTESTVYEINKPNWEKILPPKWKCWAFSKTRILDLINDNRIWFWKDWWNVPRIKRFLTELPDWIVPTSVLLHDELSWTQKASSELKKIFNDEKIFDYSKPIEIINRFLIIWTNQNDLILDFFAWSGTTGHAVMALNTEEKSEAIKNGTNPDEVGNRRYICVQLPEVIDGKSEAYKAGYMTISEITAERLRRAGKKIKEENPNVSFDSGFRLYRLTPSCYQVASVEYDSEDTQTTLESLERAIQSWISPLRDWVTQADVIVENLIKEWFLLNSRLENIQIGDNQFLHAEREWKQLYMSFESDIAMSTIQSLSKDYSEAIFVVYDKALDDSHKVMMSDRVKLRTI